MTNVRRTRAIERYRIEEGVAHREVEGQTLLLAASESNLLTLNGTGQFIWRRLARGSDVAALTSAFAREFDLGVDAARRDVEAFIGHLLDRKLIAVAGRKNVIGKPILYKTTKEFLIQFGLKDLAELPSLKEFEEIRRVAFSDAEAPASSAEAEPAAEVEESEAPPEPEAT